MAQEVIAIFDIGKTNKKFFLFDKDFKEVYRDYTQFDEIKDEDGYPTEDLSALMQWMKATFNAILKSKKYKVKTINFSSYGASFVHLNAKGQVIAPLYNYTKPIGDEILSKFYAGYGPEIDFSRVTGTTKEGMLNSGIQLYWLKHTKPELFSKISYSLHLPQYLSYLFTGIPLSEYTSIGCHTALWDYTKQDYHDWVYAENIHRILAPIVSTETSINLKYQGQEIKVGVGIHDSSAALLPYIRSIADEFILLSTGTWSITLNPFSKSSLTNGDIEHNCINYMRINGNPVKASRLFLGFAYNEKIKELTHKFNKSMDYHKQVKFEPHLYHRVLSSKEPKFNWDSIGLTKNHVQAHFESFEEAYHQLMSELVDHQIESIKRAKGEDDIKQLYIDGGFANNPVFLEMLSNGLEGFKIRTTDASLGSALGAALAISTVELDNKFLKKNYALKKHQPLIER